MEGQEEKEEEECVPREVKEVSTLPGAQSFPRIAILEFSCNRSVLKIDIQANSFQLLNLASFSIPLLPNLDAKLQPLKS